jgi:hypothetical protein
MGIFKYMSEDRIENILIDNKIRFTQPIYFNDPFEAKLIITGISSKENIEKHIESIFFEIIKEEYYSNPLIQSNLDFNSFLGIAKINKEETKKMMLKLTDDNNLHNQITRKFENTMNDGIGILSLTSRKKNLLMWAHYGNEHKGFVVEFQKEHSFFDKYESKDYIYNGIQKVIYSEKRPYKLLEDFNNEEVFLTKSKEWEYEDEYRIIKRLQDADEVKGNISLFKFPKEMIQAIYCGCNMDILKKERIIEIIKNDNELNHIKVFEMKLSDKYYELECIQVL